VRDSGITSIGRDKNGIVNRITRTHIGALGIPFIGSSESLDDVDFRCEITSFETFLWNDRDCNLEESDVEVPIGWSQQNNKTLEPDAVWRFIRAKY